MNRTEQEQKQGSRVYKRAYFREGEREKVQERERERERERRASPCTACKDPKIERTVLLLKWPNPTRRGLDPCNLEFAALSLCVSHTFGKVQPLLPLFLGNHAGDS